MSSFILSEHYNNAVKAVIFNANGKILLQKRDNHENLPFADCWNFFGGLVEENEDFLSALKRELIEEISCIPGEIDNKIFEWTWKSEWKKTINHFYPIYFNVENLDISLKEGQEMRWFSLDQILNLNLVPAIYCNFSKIYKYLTENKSIDKIVDVESISDRYFKNNNLQKKNNRVVFAKNINCSLSKQQIFLFRELSKLNKVSVSRICLHKNQKNSIQEMIMFHCVPSTVGPLRQANESISYHILDGVIKISILDKKHEVKDIYTLNSLSYSNNEVSSVRLDPSDYRIITTLSENSIFLEISNGPFKDEDTIWLKENTKKNV